MKIGIGYTNLKDSFLSGAKVIKYALKNGKIKRPCLVIAFCSGIFNHKEFFEGMKSIVGNEIPIIGGSAVGIITNDYLSYEGCPAGVAVVESDSLQPRIASEGYPDGNEKSAGMKLAKKIRAEKGDNALFVLYDSIKIPASEDSPPVLNTSSNILEGIKQVLHPATPVFGAGLIGDYAFGNTQQFCGSYVSSQSIVGLMLPENITPCFRIMHGCTPLNGIYHEITDIKGSVIYKIDNQPVCSMIDEIYGTREWRNQHPVNLLTIGVNHGEQFDNPVEKHYVNRLITGAVKNGGREGISLFESDLEQGEEIQFMLRNATKMIESAKKNSLELLDQLKAENKKPFLGLYIDCAGRTASKSHTLTEEASEVQNVFKKSNIPLLGFYSGVEIAPLLNKSRGLDWTGVLIVLSKG